MILKNPLLAVSNMDKTVRFYEAVLGLQVILDFGANKTLSGGLALQSLESWKGFIDQKTVEFGGNDTEVYFEEDDFDGFAEKLKKLDIEYVHPVREHSWGQRVVRFYDPDHHIIEVGENIEMVCRRFHDSGMSIEEVAERMDVPVDYVKACLKNDGN